MDKPLAGAAEEDVVRDLDEERDDKVVAAVVRFDLEI